MHALPVLSALRRHFPTATIGWVVEEAFAPLLRGHAAIDELIAVSLRPWRRQAWSPATWRQVGRFLRSLLEFSPEIVLDLMGNHKAGVLASLTLCDRRVGHAASSRREPSSAIWISEQVPARGDHAVDRMLSVLDGLDLPSEPADFAPHFLEETLPAEPLEPPYILLHPATGWPNKDYPAEAWGRVIALVARQTDAPIIIAPGPGEQELAERVRSAAGNRAAILSPPPLPQLVYLQRRASVVLGGDTGPTHLAHALDTPVLCVMGPTDPQRHGPYLAPGRAVWHALPCSFCHKKLDLPKACMHALDPELIAERTLELMSNPLH